jgi:hypothetical protein
MYFRISIVWFPQDHCPFSPHFALTSTTKTANNRQACSPPINLILTSCPLHLWHFFVSVLSFFLILRATYRSSRLCSCCTPVTHRYYRCHFGSRSRSLTPAKHPLHFTYLRYASALLCIPSLEFLLTFDCSLIIPIDLFFVISFISSALSVYFTY